MKRVCRAPLRTTLRARPIAKAVAALGFSLDVPDHARAALQAAEVVVDFEMLGKWGSNSHGASPFGTGDNGLLGSSAQALTWSISNRLP
jgi:hypothetical protein